MTAVPRVLIADDHPPTRAAIKRAIEADGFFVCAEAHDAEGAINEARRSAPDLAILDVRMPGGGIRAAEAICTDMPTTSVVMLTVSADDADLFAALSAGASGYLLKGQDLGLVPGILRNVLSGESVLAGSLVSRLVQEYRIRDVRQRIRQFLPAGTHLTPREWEVIELLNEGLDTAEIAQQLYIADVTVRTHVASIIRKLNVRDRTGALRLLRRGMPTGAQ